jgi:cytochrome c oxidase subunit 4
MSARTLSPAIYLIILAILLLLTVLTVGISFAPLSGQWHITIGLLIAICKASLVVLFFMHALFSPRVTWLVIAVAVLWTIILFALTLSDYLTRGQVPFTPGH